MGAARRYLAMSSVVAITGMALGLITVTGTAEPTSTAAAPDPRPNILLITTDDQNLTDLRFMPRTRRLLGRAGVTFHAMLSPHPLCCPARASLLTGQYAQNNGVRSNKPALLGGFRRLDNTSTLATWLHDAGYRTGFVGKYLNGYRGQGPDFQPGWDIWSPVVRSVYRYYGYTLQESGERRTYPKLNLTDLVSRKTVAYIRQLSGDEPFFLWSSHLSPHSQCAKEDCGAPPVPSRRHRRDFPHANSPSLRDPAFNEDDVTDKPAFISRLPKAGVAHVNTLFRARIRSLQAVDEAVAAAVRQLSREGELGSTLIIFTSDNALLLGEHRFLNKNVPYEPNLRVPLLVSGLDVPTGAKRRSVVTTNDIAPTILDAADVRPGRTVDGRSVLPIATPWAGTGLRHGADPGGPVRPPPGGRRVGVPRSEDRPLHLRALARSGLRGALRPSPRPGPAAQRGPPFPLPGRTPRAGRSYS